ncbi:MAG TPA: zinc-binding dehydrogenase [Ktedonobacteraceae bacterium]|nr:zinc-binding dehydrogenase [Ktedonobacteraceae bacterium]
MQTQTMHAVVIARFGGPEVLEVRDMPIPQPAVGQVLIKVAYAGVNYAELMARRGEFHALPTPFTPGYEVSGTIAALGSGVEIFRVGQQVAALTIQGGYAEYATARAALTFPLNTSDSSIDLEQAAAFPAVAPTAYDLLANAARMRQGESVLIHAASGGVGIAAGQIARTLGARLVLGTASSKEKAAYARTFGYDQVFLVEGFEQAVLDATGGKGIDIALDARGEPTRSQNLALLAPFGRLVVYGNASNAPEQSVLPSYLWQTNKAVIGYSITSLTQTAPHLIADTVQRVLRLMAEGSLRIDVSAVLPLEQAAEAHQRIESRSHVGKLLLRVQG